MSKDYIKLFSCCIPVRGACRSALCDVHRGDIRLIPHALHNLIPLFDTLNKEELVMHYGPEHRQTVQEYIDYLIEHELAFYCDKDELECFPLMDISVFHTPFHVTNAIVELDSADKAHITHLINELNSVECPALEIRIFSKITHSELESLLSIFNSPAVGVTELHIILIENGYDLELLKELFKKHLRLTSLIVCNAAKDERIDDFFVGNSTIIYTTRKVHLPTCCGNFAPQTFVTNLPFFTESQHHNTCLHRKVAIDRAGNIKNCPSMGACFGNISDTHLVDVIENPEFTRLWHIKKDQVAVCRDCEFRHVCMDCRAFLENPDDCYSKPLKCGYNPYTMQWEDWSANPLKQLTMNHYGMTEL